MAPESLPAGPAEPGETPEVDQLQAALFYLMTQYSFTNCPVVAAAVVDHLHMLLRHPHIDLMPMQRSALSALLNKWRIHRFDSHAGNGTSH